MLVSIWAIYSCNKSESQDSINKSIGNPKSELIGIHSQEDFDSIFAQSNDTILEEITLYTQNWLSDHLVWDSTEMIFHGFNTYGNIHNELNDEQFLLFIRQLTGQKCFTESEWAAHDDSVWQLENDYWCKDEIYDRKLKDCSYKSQCDCIHKSSQLGPLTEY